MAAIFKAVSSFASKRMRRPGGRLLRAECQTLMDEQVAQFQHGIVEIVLAPESRAPRHV